MSRGALRLVLAGLILACLPGPEARALEDVWGNPITLTFAFDPDHLVLGDDGRARVTIKVSGAEPAGTAEAPLELWTSVGALSKPERKADHWVSRYTPPKTRFPQVAVITASLILKDDRLNGWTVLPLYGKGLARVRARPRAKVWVEIEGVRFGPARADKRGRAAIPIVVPPGVDHATSSGKRIPLKLPRFNRLAGVLDADSLVCGEDGRTAVWLYAVEPDGRPAGMAELWLEADRGQVTQPESLEPGAFRAWYTPPSKLGEGKDRIQAAIRGAPGSALKLPVTLQAGPPYRIELRLSAPAWTAGSGEAVTVTAQALDEGDNPAEAEVALSTDFGALEKLHRKAPGEVSASLRLPDQLGGRETLALEARIEGGPRSSTQLGLSPAAAKWLTIEPPDGPVTADGKNEIRLTVRARDRFDNPRPAPRLSAKARLGKIRVRYGAPDGSATLHYRPPLLIDDKTDTLVVTGEAGLRAELRIELEP